MGDESNKIAEELRALQDLRRHGFLTQNLYYKGLVELAYKCFEVEAHEDALTLLTGIPVGYYQEALADQMVADEGFGFRASKVARRLILHGFVSEDQLPPVFTPTKAQA